MKYSEEQLNEFILVLNFCSIVEKGICYLSAVHVDFSLNISFSFLEQMKEHYLRNYHGTGYVSEMKSHILEKIKFFRYQGMELYSTRRKELGIGV